MINRLPLLAYFAAVLVFLLGVSLYNWWGERQERSRLEAVVEYQASQLEAKSDSIDALREDLKGRDKTIADQKAQLDVVTTDYGNFLNQMRKSSAALSNPALANSIQGSLARLRESDKARLRRD
jgi:hypothetical protein